MYNYTQLEEQITPNQLLRSSAKEDNGAENLNLRVNLSPSAVYSESTSFHPFPALANRSGISMF